MSSLLGVPIDGLPAESLRLREGGLYWLACDGVDSADALGSRLLASATGVAHAVVVSLGRSPQPMLDALAPDEGPLACSPYRVPTIRAEAAFHDLAAELARAAARDTRFCLVQFPAELAGVAGDAALSKWCRRLGGWADSNACTVVLLCHGEVATLTPRLQPLNRSVAGVAQLFPHRGWLQYLIHYWSSEIGVVAHREHAVEWHEGALRCVEGEIGDERLPTDSSDRFLFLGEGAVIDGAPPLSASWHLYDNRSTLMARALQATAATVMFALARNTDVDELACVLFRLRRERGPLLKLVVRELSPSLRYVDEQLLLDCGANLIVPANTPLSRFLTLLQPIQGQAWAGTLPADLKSRIALRHPPDMGGVVSARQFRRLVLGLLREQGKGAENIVLSLPLVAGVRPEQALRQCRIRRRGDLACAYRREVRLFLFACRADGIEQALGNMFHLPWREMFEGYQRLNEFDVGEMIDDVLEEQPPSANPPGGMMEETGEVAGGHSPQVPVRIDLGLRQ